MRARAIAEAERCHGVISRRRLLELGVPARTIQNWRAFGLLHDLHAGVYAWGHRAVSWHGRCAAAVLVGGEGAVVSHAAAAALHGLVEPRPTVDVTAPRGHAGDGTLRFHRGTLDARDVTRRDGITVTTVERTLFDLADPRLISEALAKRLTSLDALHDIADRRRGRSGAHRFALALGVPRYRSGFERRFHRWLQARGFPEPLINARVGRRTFDFVWPAARLIVETDGPHHRTRSQRASDARGEREAASHGFSTIRVAREGFDARGEEVARVIWRALASDRGHPAASI
jgi:very-short-patch-repair endonuclease